MTLVNSHKIRSRDIFAAKEAKIKENGLSSHGSPLYTTFQLGLPYDDARVNPNGGAIAIGHPLGASGARLALSTSRYLVATKGRYALVSLCVGMGQGLAVVLERYTD